MDLRISLLLVKAGQQNKMMIPLTSIPPTEWPLSSETYLVPMCHHFSRQDLIHFQISLMEMFKRKKKTAVISFQYSPGSCYIFQCNIQKCWPLDRLAASPYVDLILDPVSFSSSQPFCMIWSGGSPFSFCPAELCILTCDSLWHSKYCSPYPQWRVCHPDIHCTPHSGNSQDGRTSRELAKSEKESQVTNYAKSLPAFDHLFHAGRDSECQAWGNHLDD